VKISAVSLPLIFIFFSTLATAATTKPFTDYIYNPGKLKAIDSILKVKAGQEAPDFTLRSIAGRTISLSQFRNKHNVVLSFVPAAWTPVCSNQWPGYNIAREFFDTHDAVLLGITVDNIPTLHAWTMQMGKLWFEVLSDFWPHGAVADSYGVLRSDGTAERVLVFINKKGLISGIHVSDINIRPPLEVVVAELAKLDSSNDLGN